MFKLLLLLLGASLACAHEEDLAKRVHNHLIVKDYQAATQEAEAAFVRYPESPLLFSATLEALALHGNERTLWKFWNAHKERFPSLASQREVLEKIAWGILLSGARSTAPHLRIEALLGAFFAQNAQGVELLRHNLSDENTLIRKVAVTMAGHLRDAKLRKELMHLLPTEKNWQVRLEIIKALGKMEAQESKPILLELIGNPHTTLDETFAASEALVELVDETDRSEIERLAKSPRAGMRLLACEIMRVQELRRDGHILRTLLRDPHPSVRASALRTLGFLRIALPLEQLDLATHDKHPQVAILAAWNLTLQNPEQGGPLLVHWLQHQQKELRHLASAALGATGSYGLPWIKQAFDAKQERFVRINLALALISQRESCDAACQVLDLEMSRSQEKWEWKEQLGFRYLIPLDGDKEDSEEENQMARLEVLNTLALMQYPKAQEALRQFLQQKTWGISGMAAALLLQEGDEAAIDLVEELLNDPEEKVRLQAALILAMWGKGENAIQTLLNAYPTADRSMKEKILEGVGRIATPSCIPFLTNCLQDPYPSLRMIAAAALIECLEN